MCIFYFEVRQNQIAPLQIRLCYWTKQLLVLKEEGLVLIYYWQTKNTHLKMQTHLELAVVVIIC